MKQNPLAKQLFHCHNTCNQLFRNFSLKEYYSIVFWYTSIDPLGVEPSSKTLIRRLLTTGQPRSLLRPLVTPGLPAGSHTCDNCN